MQLPLEFRGQDEFASAIGVALKVLLSEVVTVPSSRHFELVLKLSELSWRLPVQVVSMLPVLAEPVVTVVVSIASLNVTCTGGGVFVIVTLSASFAGRIETTVGTVVSKVKLPGAFAAGALFPARSFAVPAGMDTVRDPSPVRLSNVIVRLPVPEPVTALLPEAAVPVDMTVTLSSTSVTLSAHV